MVPYQGCQQHGCWLIRFFRAPNIPLPNFFIGQRVYAEYPGEDETTLERQTGLVMGLVYQSRGLSTRLYTPGWYYLVRWDDIPVSRSLMTYVEVHELDLAPEAGTPPNQ